MRNMSEELHLETWLGAVRLRFDILEELLKSLADARRINAEADVKRIALLISGVLGELTEEIRQRFFEAPQPDRRGARKQMARAVPEVEEEVVNPTAPGGNVL